MKGRLELRYDMKNAGKLRSRVENPQPELTQELRKILASAAAEVLEENQVALKAKIIARLEKYGKEKNIKFNSAQHKLQVTDVTGDIFTTFFCATKEEFEARFGKSEEKGEDGEEPEAEPDAKESGDEEGEFED